MNHFECLMAFGLMLWRVKQSPPPPRPQTELWHQYRCPGGPDRIKVQQPPGLEEPLFQVSSSLDCSEGFQLYKALFFCSISNMCACMYVQVHRHHSQPPSRLTLHLPIWEHVEHGSSLQHESGDGCIRWTHRVIILYLSPGDTQHDGPHLLEGSWLQPANRSRKSSSPLTGGSNYSSLLQDSGYFQALGRTFSMFCLNKEKKFRQTHTR